MKKIIFLAIILILGYIVLNEAKAFVIPAEAIRLRVVANSNSEYDQKIKKEVSEVVTLPVTGLNGTLVISIGQEGRVISLVSDRFANHTKDYIFNGTPAQWASQFERQAAMEDMDRLIDVTVDAAGDTLTISAKDCYTRIEKVVYEGATKQVWERADKYKKATLRTNTWTGDTLVPGTEGMGTVTRILKNMRLQTNAHLSAHGFDMDERPLPRGEYEQWTIQYVSERRHQSGEVFGSINHSLVTLIFFVEKNVIGNGSDDLWDHVLKQLATDANVTRCNVAQPGLTVDTDNDKVADADADGIPGDQVTNPATDKPIDAKKKH